MITAYGAASAPAGWLLCDGSAVSRTVYANLFTAISTTYGVGDGSTTFNVPNLKGRVIVGYDSADTAFDVVGETGGAKTHTHAAHSDHSSLTHSGATVGNHDALTNNHSGSAVSNHADHSHSIPVVGAMTAGGSNVTTANTNGVSTSGAYTHSVTQPSAHGAISAHSVGQASAHTVSAHSAHDSPSHLMPYMAIPYIIKT
jgi:microcystin-dependent protein